MSNDAIMALTSVLLVLVSVVQISMLVIQNRQNRLELLNDFRARWHSARVHLGDVIFIGRNDGDYYQLVNEERIKTLQSEVGNSTKSGPTVWALTSVQIVSGIMNEVCVRILQGQLHVSEAYPVFGTLLLRQTNPMRVLLDSDNYNGSSQWCSENHLLIRKELQDWLIYHDGTRRRCLILLDLLWAEATRLGDLPPHDILCAATAKIATGKLNRQRVFTEALLIQGLPAIFNATRLRLFLLKSEFKSFWNPFGVSKSKLANSDRVWTRRLLRNHPFTN